MTETTTPVLLAGGVSVSFQVNGQERRVVHDIDLRLERGQVTVLLGESGSGKTVFARSIAGLAPRGARTSGHAIMGGEDLLALSARRLRRLHGSRIGSVPQDPVSALDPMRRVGSQIVETLIQHRATASRAEARERATELLRLVQIHEPERVLGSYPHQLSGGMRQRIAIAIAISCEPELIVADEPSSALDASVGARVVELLGDLRERLGTAILMITHDIGVAARIAQQPQDRVAVMLAGRLVELGSAQTVLADPRHPYTQALVDAEPSGETRRGELATVPDWIRAQRRWSDLTEVAPGHLVAHAVEKNEEVSA